MSPQEEFQSITATEAVTEGIKEGVGAFLGGVATVAGTLFEGMGQAADHLIPLGASEIAAGLFNGSGFVMYPHQVGQPSVEVQQPEISQSHEIDQPEMSRGGMSM